MYNFIKINKNKLNTSVAIFKNQTEKNYSRKIMIMSFAIHLNSSI